MRKGLLLCMLALASCDKPAATQTAAAQVGRYTITYSRVNARDTFLIDTATGDNWQLVDRKDGSSVWQKMERIDPGAARTTADDAASATVTSENTMNVDENLTTTEMNTFGANSN